MSTQPPPATLSIEVDTRRFQEAMSRLTVALAAMFDSTQRAIVSGAAYEAAAKARAGRGDDPGPHARLIPDVPGHAKRPRWPKGRTGRRGLCCVRRSGRGFAWVRWWRGGVDPSGCRVPPDRLGHLVGDLGGVGASHMHLDGWLRLDRQQRLELRLLGERLDEDRLGCHRVPLGHDADASCSAGASAGIGSNVTMTYSPTKNWSSAALLVIVISIVPAGVAAAHCLFSGPAAAMSLTDSWVFPGSLA